MVRLTNIQSNINPEQTTNEEEKINEIQDVPLVRFNSKLDGLDEKVLLIKLRKYSKNFKASLDQVLTLYPIDQLKYSSHLVGFVMHEVERFLLKPKSGQAKRDLVINCVKKYFDDNEHMVGVVIDLLMPNLKQVKFIGRQFLKVVRFFSNRKLIQ